MAELNIFHYNPKNSKIHRMEPTLKLISLFVFSIICSLADSNLMMLPLTVLIAVILISSKLPLLIYIKELNSFLKILLVIIVLNTLSLPGTPLINLNIFSFVPTYEGLLAGLVFSWKILLIISICTVFTGTTSLSSIRNAVENLLRPIPFVRESSVATMFSLVFVLLPLIFDQASEITEAQQSRCISKRINPVQRIKLFSYPLLLNTFLRADQIVAAMESRCYSEHRTKTASNPSHLDWYLFLGFIAYCCLVLIVKFYI